MEEMIKHLHVVRETLLKTDLQRADFNMITLSLFRDETAGLTEGIVLFNMCSILFIKSNFLAA